MARKRKFSTFSLSFLDIMSCGFGAVALIFLIIKHDIDTQVETTNVDLQAEVDLLQEEVSHGEENLVRIRNTISNVDEQLAEANGLARSIREAINDTEGKVESLDSQSDEDIEKIRQRLQEMAKEKEKLKQQEETAGNDAIEFLGDGDRQYLTGLKLGGSRILILLDASSSMLDSTIVNIIRRRNMSDNMKRASRKWQRAIRTTEWLTAQFPKDSTYQIFTFNTATSPINPKHPDDWMQVKDSLELQGNINDLRRVVPGGGTSLERAFIAIQSLTTPPDNIFLITDGLPTQGLNKPKRQTVTEPERLKLFRRAVASLPVNIPVNVILLPMEGDPRAASEFWKLAQVTQGSFLSPSRDWP